MKKTLIALSLIALSGAASAEVILYGQIKAGVEVSRTTKPEYLDSTSRTRGHTETQIADFGSRIGFKGTEHLGSGLNAIWQVEQKTPLGVSDNDVKGWGTRDSFIGLEGESWGKIRVGKISTQLNDMDAIDPWEYSNNALGLGVFTRNGERVTSVRYDSPVFAGFSFNAQYTPRDNQVTTINSTDATGRDNSLNDTGAYYAGLNYENSGFFAQYGGAYQHSRYLDNSTTPVSKAGHAHQVQVGYDANNLFAGVGYQYTDGWDTYNSYVANLYSDNSYSNGDDLYTGASGDTAAAALTKGIGLKTHEIAATASYTFGNVTPRVSYAHGFKAKAKNGNLTEDQRKKTQYDQVVVGADYDFSKRTTAMISAGWLKAGKSTTKAETVAGLVGLRHKF